MALAEIMPNPSEPSHLLPKIGSALSISYMSDAGSWGAYAFEVNVCTSVVKNINNLYRI